MATKPSSNPRWGDVGGDIVEPSSGQKDVGFVAGQKAPAQFLNWLLNLLYQWIVYLSDGVFQHSTKTLTIPAAAGLPDPFTGNWEYSATAMRWTEPGGTGGDRVVYPIILDVGERIVAVRAKIRDTNDGAGALLMKLWDADATAATPTQIGATQTSNHDGTRKTLTLSGLTTTVTVAHSYSIEITSGASGGASTNESISVEVDYDRVTS
jgi:hypothetical protein